VVHKKRREEAKQQRRCGNARSTRRRTRSAARTRRAHSSVKIGEVNAHMPGKPRDACAVLDARALPVRLNGV